MKASNSFPTGPVLMVFGVVLLVSAALSASAVPWLCVLLGLSGIALFFLGFRFLAGPNHIPCPRCQAKNYIRNQNRRALVADGALTCVKCGTILRRDSLL